MPFTFSHPAIVLPLVKYWPRWFSLTGLVAGSIVPDFEYFIRLKVYSKISHTWYGLFLLDLPLAFLLGLIFHILVRDPLIRHLPRYFRLRFSRYLHTNWRGYFRQHYPVVLASLLLGAFSHQFWDGFTHRPEFFVKRLPPLQQSVWLFGSEVPVYRVIQHASSVLGAAFILWVIHRLPKNKPPVNAYSYWWYWPTVAGIALVLFVLRIVVPYNFSSAGNIVVAAISGILLGLTLASAAVRNLNTGSG